MGFVKLPYKCKHFKIQELVPPDVYNKFGEQAWQFLDERILMSVDCLRDDFGSITVNDWLWGGNFIYSGLRPPNCKVGADFSSHRFGRALDPKFKEHSAESVRKRILAAPESYPHITEIELDTATWVHIGCRNMSSTKGIWTFKP